MGLKLHNALPTATDEEAAHKHQELMARKIRQGMGWSLVTGVDVAYGKDDMAYAVAVSVSTSNWKPVEVQKWSGPAPIPYQSGMLGFREAPLLIEVLLKLTHTPDVIFVDGNGRAHPRRFGSACHIGLALDHPTIGIGKNYPAGVGTPNTAKFGALTRGNRTAIMHGSEKVGYELTTQDKTNPIYVSVGNRLGLEEAVTMTLKATPFYRLPEPIRAADQHANAYRTKEEAAR